MAPISSELFKSTIRHVKRELKQMGFGRNKLLKTKIFRTLVPTITTAAYFVWEDSWLKYFGGFREGTIYVPILQSKYGLRDTLRHEYAHALLYHYPNIEQRFGFKIFGSSHKDVDYVSDYAQQNAEEDFCETFMLYLKHKGKIPTRLAAQSDRIVKKWQFIEKLAVSLN